jgi:DMSO/TMAO reductase YedYZ molybdopterin-dependent catalytic subunit
MPKRPLLEPRGVRRRTPLTPAGLTSEVTPAEDVIVLAHLGIPRISEVGFSLEVGGMVRRPLSLGLETLKRRPKLVCRSFHECAGNPLHPLAPTRRIANVVWGGASLSDVLREAEPLPGARFIWSYGLDYGEFEGVGVDAYVKDLPLARALAGDAMLVYELNGAPLDPEHGFPLRLVVPGFYGTNSVKWLCRISVEERRADGPFTTIFYNDPIAPSPRLPSGGWKPVWEVAPHSLIVRPATGAAVKLNETVEIWGWAWGEKPIAAVEIEIDGATQGRAEVATRQQWSWQRFALAWRPHAPGAVRLASRAIDTAGCSQPREGARNALYSVDVTVAP